MKLREHQSSTSPLASLLHTGFGLNRAVLAEDQHNCYINGQNDALSLTKPEEPNNQCYMMGWEETMIKIAKGEIKPELLDSNYPESTADEEF